MELNWLTKNYICVEKLHLKVDTYIHLSTCVHVCAEALLYIITHVEARTCIGEVK